MQLFYELMITISVVLFASDVSAQCSKDTDCKGDRVCQAGTCVDPTSNAVEVSKQPSGLIEKADPCAQINCSGRGSCIVKSGEPFCACHDGYAPDTKGGFSCLPLQASQGAVQPSDKTQDQKEVKAKEDFERVKAALPEFDHESDYHAYTRTVALGRTHLSFIDYKKLRIQKFKRHGIARLVIGSFFTAAGIADIVAAAVVLSTGGDDAIYKPLFIAGPILATIGIPVLISGIVRAKKWPRMEKGMRSLESALRSTRTVTGKFAIAPLFSKETSFLGLAGVYYF